MPVTAPSAPPYSTGHSEFRSRDVEDGSTSGFTSCGTQCLETSSANLNCHTTDSVQCICQDLIARPLAFLCLLNQCPKSDYSQLSQDCDNGTDSTIAPNTKTTIVPRPTVATSETPASSSSPSRPPSPFPSLSPSTFTSMTISKVSAASATPSPISTPDASGATASVTLVSNSTMDGPRSGTGPPTSSVVATSDTPPPYESSKILPPAPSSPGSHRFSTKASIALSAGLGVAALVALFAFVCLRGRQRRRRGTTLARCPVFDLAESDDASVCGALSAVARRSPSMASVSVITHPTTIHISGAMLLSSSTAPSTLQSTSDGRVRPSSAHGALGARDARLSSADKTPLSHRRQSSSWDQSLFSTRAAVGGSGEPPAGNHSYTTADRGSFDTGARDHGRDGAGSWLRVPARSTDAAKTAASRPCPNVNCNPEDTPVEKMPTPRDDQGLETARDMDLQPPLPGLLAPSLVPSGVSTLDSAGVYARRSGALRAPRFVTVLMEIEEEEVVGRGDPPPYQRCPEEVHSGAQE